jgi:hypothetical protein
VHPQTTSETSSKRAKRNRSSTLRNQHPAQSFPVR